jgi:hypothetical protein
MSSVESLIASGRLEEVEADPEMAAIRLDESQRHIASAEAIAETDPNGAFQLAYDAARKAATAHMARSGLRVKGSEGSHAVTAQYVTAAMSADLGKRLNRMRRRRNVSEYGSTHFEAREIADAMAVASALVRVVEA